MKAGRHRHGKPEDGLVFPTSSSRTPASRTLRLTCSIMLPIPIPPGPPPPPPSFLAPPPNSIRGVCVVERVGWLQLLGGGSSDGGGGGWAAASLVKMPEGGRRRASAACRVELRAAADSTQ